MAASRAAMQSRYKSCLMAAQSSFEGNTCSGGMLDRAGNQRRDPAWIEAQRAAPNGRYLPLWRLKAPIASEGPRLYWTSAEESGAADGAATILLGIDGEGIPHFATDLQPGDEAPPLGDAVRYEEVRTIAPAIRHEDTALLAQARSLIDWHARHGYCAVCGAPTLMDDAGYVRRCSNEDCRAQHFPRTDPVVIMLIHHGEDCLIGRQKWFPEGFYSTLAGFMEPGESIEEAVRREVVEETNIAVGPVRYHSSQPWPYPSSLMIGCIGEATETEIAVDDIELDDARWVDRKTIRAAVERVTEMSADPLARPDSLAGIGDLGLKVPGPMAIAHQLMRAWAMEEG